MKGGRRGIAAAAVIRGYFQKIDLQFSEEEGPDGVVFRGLAFAKGDIIDVYQWKIVVDDECVQSFFNLPTHVRPARRQAVAEYCMFVNHRIRWGKLTEDIHDDGEVRFCLCVPSASMKGDPEIEVDRLLCAPTVLLERFTPGLIDVIQGRSPREAYEDCVRLPTETDDDTEEDGDGGPFRSLDDAEPPPRVASSGAASYGDSRPMGRACSDDHATQTDRLAEYSLEGLNVHGDIPLSRIVSAVALFNAARARGEDVLRMNILLSGPPGCGKSAFVEYLGHEVGSEVMTITASDVLSPMVGQTEQRIAQIFHRASESGSILFLDEVDSLLSNRANASYNWEVTQVNELLQQMERFGGVMVGATNFESCLDPAVARRFTFKLRMDYLDGDGKRTFFARFFKEPMTPEQCQRLEAIPSLTPGDFRTVWQKLYYLSDKQGNDSRLDALETESASKGTACRKIGF